MTDNEIIKALEEWLEKMRNSYLTSLDLGEYVTATNIEKNMCLLRETIDIINRQKADLEKFTKRQKPTAASGYKIENGKVVFFTNMLGSYREEKENLEEVVKTLNELLQECYSKDEIAFALKCKTEELKTAEAEVERLTIRLRKAEHQLDDAMKMYNTIKAEAYKEFVERLKGKYKKHFSSEWSAVYNTIDNLLKELVGEDK